jgi:hypothetical protein
VSPQVFNVVLGVWLFISAFLWPHHQASMLNAWITGAFVVIFAALSTRVPELRYANTALAVWLFISVWALPDISAETTWNNAIVAVGILVISLVPQSPRRTRTSGQG